MMRHADCCNHSHVRLMSFNSHIACSQAQVGAAVGKMALQQVDMDGKHPSKAKSSSSRKFGID